MSIQRSLAADVLDRVGSRLERVLDWLFLDHLPWHPLRDHVNGVLPANAEVWPGRDLFLQRQVWGKLPPAAEALIEARLPAQGFPTDRGLLSLLLITETFEREVVRQGGASLYDNPALDRYYSESFDQQFFAPLADGTYRISYAHLLEAVDRPRARIRRLYENLWKSVEMMSVPIAVHAWHLGTVHEYSDHLLIPPTGDISVALESNLDLWLDAVALELQAIHDSLLKAHQEIRALRNRDLFGEILAMAPSDQQAQQDFADCDAAWNAARDASLQASRFEPRSSPGWWSWRPQVIGFHACTADPRVRDERVVMLQPFMLAARVAGAFTPNDSARSMVLRGEVFNHSRQWRIGVPLYFHDAIPAVTVVGGTHDFSPELLFVSGELLFNHPSSQSNQPLLDIPGFPGETVEYAVEEMAARNLEIAAGDDDDDPQPFHLPAPMEVLTLVPLSPATGQPAHPSAVFDVRYDPGRFLHEGPVKVLMAEGATPLAGHEVVFVLQRAGQDLMSFCTLTDDDGVAVLDFSWQGGRTFYPAPDALPVLDRPLDQGDYVVEVFPLDPMFACCVAREVRFQVGLVVPTVITFTSAEPVIGDRRTLSHLLGDAPFLVRMDLGDRDRAAAGGQNFTLTLTSTVDSTTVDMRPDPQMPGRYHAVQPVYPNTSLLTDFGANDIDIEDQTSLRVSAPLADAPSASIHYIADGEDPISASQSTDAATRGQSLMLESALNEIAVAINVARELAQESEDFIVEHKLAILNNARRFIRLTYEPHQFNTPTLAYRNFVVAEYVRLLTLDVDSLSPRDIPDLLRAAHVTLDGIFPSPPVIRGVDAGEVRIINAANNHFLTDINVQVLRSIQSFVVAGLDFVGNALMQFVVPIDSFNAVLFNETPDGFQATFVERALGLFDLLPLIPTVPHFRPVGALPNPGGTNFKLMKVGRAAERVEHRAIHSFLDLMENIELSRILRADEPGSLVPLLQQQFVRYARDVLASRLSPSSSAYQRLEEALAITTQRIHARAARLDEDIVAQGRIQAEFDALKLRWRNGERTMTLARDLARKARRLQRKNGRIRAAKVKFLNTLIERERRFNRALGNASGANLSDDVVRQMIADGVRLKSHDKVRGIKAWNHYELDVLEFLNASAGAYPFSTQDSVRLNTTYMGRYPSTYSSVVPAGVEKRQFVVRPDMSNALHEMVEVKYYFFEDIAHDAQAVERKADMLWESIQKGRKAQFTRLRAASPAARNLDLWDQAHALPFRVFTPQLVPQAVIDRFIAHDPAMARVRFQVLPPNVERWLTR